MNVNQIGLYNQNSDQSKKVSAKTAGSSETIKGSHIRVGQSSIQNAIASSSSVYGKGSNVQGTTETSGDSKSKSMSECFEDIKNRMTEEDATAIEDEGMSLEKYNAERLERAVARIKQQKQQKQEAIEGAVDKREQVQEDIEKIAVQNATEGVQSAQVVTALENANLPITDENVAKITQALELTSSISELSDAGMAYMIANEMKPTALSFYQAEHMGRGLTARTSGNNVGLYEAINVAYDISDSNGDYQVNVADWDKIKDQVAAVVEQAGMEASDDVMEQCQWLFQNDLPITEESIKNLLEIQDIKSNYNQKEALQFIIENYEDGIEPQNADMSGFSKKPATDNLDSFLQSVEEHLQNDELKIQDVTLHRQLEEVRLKMTVEASQKLEDMGIQIDLEHIEDIIQGLRQIENSYYKELFTEAGIDATEEQVALLQQTAEQTESLKTMPLVSLGKTVATKDVQTLDSLVEAGIETKAQLEKAGEAYETMGTEVRKDLGDSIKKAFQNVEDILKDLGLESTEANIRAVKILGYNSIPITEEAIMEMKGYDSQVQELMEGLKPAVTVQMIKSGLNPLETPIEEVNEMIRSIQEEIGVSDEEKYSEFLWKLDKKDSLTQDERKAFIGMYRMLHQIEKSDGAAIGSVIKAGRELTLDNLMTSVKTSKSGGVDASVNDEFGSLESINQENETIQQQVEYYRRVSHSILDKVEPQHLEDGSISLEQLKENVDADSEADNKEYMHEKLNHIYEVVSHPDECIAFLEGNGQEVTLETMMAAEQLLNNQGMREFFKKLEPEKQDELAQDAEQLVEEMDQDSFEAEFDAFTEKMQEYVKEEMGKDTISHSDISMLRLVGSSLQLTGSLSRQESYNFPMVLGNTVGNVNVTVQHKEESGGKVEISYTSEKLGDVQAQLTVRDGEIKGFIMTDSQPGLQLIKSEENAMTNGFEALGFDVKQVDYSLFSSRRLSSGVTGDSDVSSAQLLKAAKVFIGTLSAIERREG